MMVSQFDSYGKMAIADVDDTHQNGRYLSQKEAEKLIPLDVMRKLEIVPDDRVIDIGCGIGTNLIPLSRMVRSVVGCDHPLVIEKLRQRVTTPNVSFAGGNFLEVKIDQSFSKVLLYSVVPSLPDEATLFAMVHNALSLLEPDGIMLVGDFSNVDKKRRFLESERGKAFSLEWEETQRKFGAADKVTYDQYMNTGAVRIDDAMIFRLLLEIRAKGFEAYVTEQPWNLPFGNTREDMVIIGPERVRKGL